MKEKYYKYHSYFPVAFIFLLPFGLLHNVVLGLWFLFLLLNTNLKESISMLFKNKLTLLCFAFFGLYCAYYFFTNNTLEARTAIEIKLSLIVFPILMLSQQFLLSDFKKICLAFIISNFVTATFCLLRATNVYLTENKNEFFYGDFSVFLHSSYAAMYAMLALLILLVQFQFQTENKWMRITINGLIFTVLSVSIFLYSSKMGIISFLILMPITILFSLAKRKSYKTIAAVLTFGLLAIFFTYRFMPSPFNRLIVAFEVSSSSEKIDKNAIESTAVRILIWKEALQIIKANLWLGVGPGDANEALQKAYKKNDLTGANEKKLNAHNEFLQIGIGLGILGLLVFTSLFMSGFFQAFQYKNILIALFLLLIIFNFLVESMLQRQSGVLFFVFFLCLFLHPDFKSSISDKNITK